MSGADVPAPARQPTLEERRHELRRFALEHAWAESSSGDVAALITDTWSGQGPLRFADQLEPGELEASGAVMFTNARAVLDATREHGLMPQAPRNECPIQLFERDHSFGIPAFRDEIRAGLRPPAIFRRYIEPLHLTQTLLAVAGLLEGQAGYRLTAEGRRLLDPESAGELYVRLFVAYFRRLDLACLDAGTGLPGIQDLMPYWLWVLAGAAGEYFFNSGDFFVQIFMPRSLVDTLDTGKAPARLRALIQSRFLDSLADFGLLEPKGGDDETKELGDVRFRRTPLFSRLLRFDIPPPQPARGRGHLRLIE